MVNARKGAIKVRGEVVLDWGNGIRLRITPISDGARGDRASAATGETRGRKPSPATLRVREAMQADRAAGKVRDRSHYLGILREAGHTASATSANIILAREAKRILGQPLARGKRGSAGRPSGRGPGRQPAPETVLLRERLASDAAKGKTREATHYLKWLVDQPGVKAGLKQLRPMVYRELRKAQ